MPPTVSSSESNDSVAAGGREAYKWRFADEDPGAESRVLSSGPVGDAARVAFNFARSLPPPMWRRVLSVAGLRS